MAYTTIDDGSAYFQTKLYTGTGSSNSVTNDGNSDLQPDWVWIKERDGTGQHGSFDSSRGVQKELKIDDFYPVYRGYNLKDMPLLSEIIIKEIGIMISDKIEDPFNIQIDWIKAK